MKARLWVRLTAVMVFCGLAWSLRGTQAPRARAAGDDTTPRALGFAGNSSCSARNCHGRSEPVQDKDAVSLRNESTTCVVYDKHTQAYEVLLGPRARRIAENLAPTNAGGQKIEAHRDTRCLACHTTPQAAPQPDPSKDVGAELLEFRSGGVSCEACHGPANRERDAGGQKTEPWFALHTRTDWAKKSTGEKGKYGMVNLADLPLQARVCAGCHVGAPPDEKNGIPARDLHHDLMGAGHPRLTFELSAYRINMPPHWNVDLKQKEGGPGPSEARVWAVGRAVAANVSAELLRYRAGLVKDGKSARWPEFAEYRCFACHASLNPDWRERRPHRPGAPVGALPYDPWYGALLPELAQAVGGAQPEEVRKAYDRIADEMSRPWPDPSVVADDAGSLVKLLGPWVSHLDGAKYDPRAIARALVGARKEPPRTWEEATQLALAVAALKHDAVAKFQKQRDADPAARPPEDLAALGAFFRALSFPPGATRQDTFESPRGVDGPVGSIPGVKDSFQELLKALER